MVIPPELTYKQSDSCQRRMYCKNFWFCSKIYPNDLQMRSNFRVAKVVSNLSLLKIESKLPEKKNGFFIPILLRFVKANMNYLGSIVNGQHLV